jgi:hypothetical protein
LSVAFDSVIEYTGSREAVTTHVSDTQTSDTGATLNEHAPLPAADSRASTVSQATAMYGSTAEDDATSDGWEWWAGDGWDDPDPRDEDYDQDAEHASWLASLPAGMRAEYEAGPWTGAGESIPAGFLHHDHDVPSGAGFAAGGALDGLAPGPLLAGAAAAAAGSDQERHGALGESELIGVLCGWQRLASWAQAGQAAAVIALARRRAAQAAAGRNRHLAEHTDDEVAAALTLTGRAASRLTSVAAGLDRLPEVLAALRAGQVDWARACVFVDELAALDDADAGRLARQFLGRGGGWTTGQLRHWLRRAVLQHDPGAAGQRRREARKDARVEAWDEPSGNAALAGRQLRPADVIAIDKQLTSLAEWLQSMGAAGTISQLRAAAYTALLAGRELATLLPPAAPPADSPDPGSTAGDSTDPDSPAPDSAATESPDPGGSAADGTNANRAAAPGPAAGGDASGAGWPRLTGTVHLTMPLSAWAGLTGSPGEVAGHGPADAGTCRELAALMGTSARWCLTLTGPGDRAVAHACARRPPPPPGPGLITWAAGLRDNLATLETGLCGHARRSPRYVPPPNLAHLIRVRQRTCSFPGCRRAAVRCDIDHTVPYHRGGITCECNLAPLCRHHHRCKQAEGWQLTQARPGEMTWRTPSGRSYTTTGDPYPV